MNRDYSYGRGSRYWDNEFFRRFKGHDRLDTSMYRKVGDLEDEYFNSFLMARNDNYTRVPPLKDLGLAELMTASYPPPIFQFRLAGLRLRGLKQAIQRKRLAVGHPSIASLLALFSVPKTYTPEEGYTINWQDQRLRWLALLLVLMVSGLVLGLSTPWTHTSRDNHGVSSRNQTVTSRPGANQTAEGNRSAAPPIVNNEPNKSGSSTTSNPDSSASMEPASSSSPASNSKTSSSTSESSPSSSSSSSPGSSTAESGSSTSGGQGSSSGSVLPITIPGEILSAAGKQIISTGSTTVN